MKSIAHHPAEYRNLAIGTITPPLDGVGDSFAVRAVRLVLWLAFIGASIGAVNAVLFFR